MKISCIGLFSSIRLKASRFEILLAAIGEQGRASSASHLLFSLSPPLQILTGNLFGSRPEDFASSEASFIKGATSTPKTTISPRNLSG
jgi:hypothetical protein